MKKQILKEISDTNKSLKNELKVKSENHNEIKNLENKIMIIEKKLNKILKTKQNMINSQRYQQFKNYMNL